MIRIIAAVAALTSATSLPAQSAISRTIDFSTVPAVGGTWTYAPQVGGSEATFANAQSQPQVVIRCTRATRRVTIAKPATAASAFLSVWTSAQTRNIPASFNPATGRVTAELLASDPLLDAMAYSRGRIALSLSGQAPLVVPSWAEVGRVVEDCRV